MLTLRPLRLTLYKAGSLEATGFLDCGLNGVNRLLYIFEKFQAECSSALLVNVSNGSRCAWFIEARVVSVDCSCGLLSDSFGNYD